MKHFILLLLLIFSGCSHRTDQIDSLSYRPKMVYKIDSEMKRPLLATGTIVHLLLATKFPNAHIVMNDDTYALVDTKWLEKDFSSYFNKVIKKTKKGNYPFDCDDFVRLFRHELQLSHIKGKVESQSYLIGEIHYVDVKQDDIEIRHALCGVFSVQEGNLILLFFEPQECKFVALSEEQVESIYFLRF